MTSPTIADGVVYIASLSGHIHAIDQQTGTEKWKFKSSMPVASSPTVADGLLYFVSSGGDLKHGLGCGFDSQVPIRRNPQNYIGSQCRAGWQGQANFSSFVRRETSAHPPALLPDEDKLFFFLRPQIVLAYRGNQAVDDERVAPHLLGWQQSAARAF